MIKVGDVFVYDGNTYVAMSVELKRPETDNEYYRVYTLADIPTHHNWNGFYGPYCEVIDADS